MAGKLPSKSGGFPWNALMSEVSTEHSTVDRSEEDLAVMSSATG